MITGKKEELDDIAKSYVCKDDGGHLTVAWHAKENSYVLRCQHDHYPEEVTRQPSLSQMYKQGEELPEPVQSNVKKAVERRAARLPQGPQAETFTGIPATDLGTGELLPLSMLQFLSQYARKYGLDPARGHVCLMYGKPYVTIDGYYYHAKREGIPYNLAIRPLSEEERKTWQLEDGDHAWVSQVELVETGATFTGQGIVTKDEREEKSKRHPGQLASPAVAAHPWQLAQKRAEWHALRRAFPIGGESPDEEVKP